MTQNTDPNLQKDSQKVSVSNPQRPSGFLRSFLFVVTPVLLIIFITLSIGYYLFGAQNLLTFLASWVPRTEDARQDTSQTVNFVELDSIKAELHNPTTQLLSIKLVLDVDRTGVPKGQVLPFCTVGVTNNLPISNVSTIEQCKPVIQIAIKDYLLTLTGKDFTGGSATLLVRQDLTRIISRIIDPIGLRALFILDLSFSG